ncbi:MAG: protein kinase [bacterium]
MNRDPVADPKAAQKTGVLFECAAETNCPHCNAVVPLTNAIPLSTLLCPACGGKILVPGRVGGFLLHEHIGEGEMGTIYRATDESLKRDVAVKLVRGCHADDPESCERLRHEACAAGKLNHPRVAQVYALNFSNGHPYLVMELVTGQDFAQKLQSEGRIDERTALRMALDVADGLSALNREGLIHGDIKPGNIVLDRDGNAKLVDFGLSGMTRRDGYGALVGTPNYIAPELLRGATDTHRSDLYSLGATLYHLLSGRPPFDGETPADVLKARLFQPPAPLGTHAHHVSAPTRKLIMRMLELNPEKRPANSDAVATDIRAALTRLDSPTPATPGALGFARRFFAPLRWPLRPQPLVPSSQRRAFVIVILGLIAVVELLIAAREHSFTQTFEWLRREVATPLQTMALTVSRPPVQPGTDAPVQKDADSITPMNLPISQPPPGTTVPVREDILTTEANLIWQSMNLGEHTQGGSTMQMGGTMIVQGTGTDMWAGDDSCRFVWTKSARNYAFSAQIKVIAVNNSLAITGLLIKGEDPALGPGLLFGFLGSGELFLQIRQPNNKVVVVKRSERPIRLPSYLKIIRRDKAFEACVSVDGRVWNPFAACELDLPSGNTIGFAVSAQIPNTLATAKFAGIRLLTPSLPGATQTHDVPAVTRKPVRAASTK